MLARTQMRLRDSFLASNVWWAAIVVAGWCVSPIALAQPDDWPRIRIEDDNTVITESCVIESGVYAVADEDENGVLHIDGNGITVAFEDGAILDGKSNGQEPNEFVGTGIRIGQSIDVVIQNATVRGFKVGIHASNTKGLIVESTNISGNFRQKLKSTPEKEVSSDWMYPHRNEQHQWMNNYGAGLYIERSSEATIRNIRCRDGQNGIILDRVDNSKVYDCDCSFISGWGLAMWRSNDNLISRNAFDFCIRGYSHGVYNRGQDSAGILMFEQCSRNRFFENSCTHGGDGFFGTAGRSALGETWVEAYAEGALPTPDDVKRFVRRGSNDNVFIRNDLSYAAAHGFELTFGFGNQLYNNRIVENAICGVWGGYSQKTIIKGNTLERNGDAGYGLERGGINIEHGKDNVIEWNRFKENECGIHLWWDADEGLRKFPWVIANEDGSRSNRIANNRFDGDTVAVQVRETYGTTMIDNRMMGVRTEVMMGVEDDVDDPSTFINTQKRTSMTRYAAPRYQAIGESRPVGARPHLVGRHNIIMTEWGPWDHEAPLVRIADRDGSTSGDHIWEIWNAPLISTIEIIAGAHDDVVATAIPATDEDDPAVQRFAISAPAASGLYPYAVRVLGDAYTTTFTDTITKLGWDVSFFEWTEDPRTAYEGWIKESVGPTVRNTWTNQLRFQFGNDGPGEIWANSGEVDILDGMPTNHFGTKANCSIQLDAGTYTITTVSDDGIRVWAGDELVIDDWTWHGPTEHHGSFTLSNSQVIDLRVEHFEIDGYAWLVVELKPEVEPTP